MNKKCDSAIKHHVEAELKCCSNLDQTDIAVKVTGGIVTLTGYVRDFMHKYHAEDAAKRVAGVVAIANDIQVQAAAAISDPEIARDSVAALKRQLPLHWQQIRPMVRQGSVTLEGVVDANYQRKEAEQAVSGLPGVLCVVNALGLAPGAHVVRPEDVQGMIEDSFRRTGQRDPGDISVEANGAAVTLRGHVRGWSERSQAERSAWSTLGVQSVRNELKVQFEDADKLMHGSDTH